MTPPLGQSEQKSEEKVQNLKRRFFDPEEVRLHLAISIAAVVWPPQCIDAET